MFLSIGVPFVWVATEGEGHKLEFEALSVLSIGCLPLFACENKIWPIRHLSIRHRWLAPLAAWSGKCQEFGMQRCAHIGIAAQQHVDMLLVVWVSSLHLCPVQDWFRHEALVCGCLINRKNTENASGSGQAQSTFLFYPFFIWFNSGRTTFAPPKQRAPSRLTPPTFPNNLGNILDRGPLHLRRTCTMRCRPGPSRALHQLFPMNRRVKFYMPCPSWQCHPLSGWALKPIMGRSKS